MKVVREGLQSFRTDTEGIRDGLTDPGDHRIEEPGVLMPGLDLPGDERDLLPDAQVRPQALHETGQLRKIGSHPDRIRITLPLVPKDGFQLPVPQGLPRAADRLAIEGRHLLSAPVRLLVHRVAEPPLGCVRQPLAQGRAAPRVHHKQDAPPGAGVRLRGETVREAHPLHVHRLPDGAVAVERFDGRDRFAPVIQQIYALQGRQRIGRREHPAPGHIRLPDQQVHIVPGAA